MCVHVSSYLISSGYEDLQFPRSVTTGGGEHTWSFGDEKGHAPRTPGLKVLKLGAGLLNLGIGALYVKSYPFFAACARGTTNPISFILYFCADA
jgi:hypothetical protein